MNFNQASEMQVTTTKKIPKNKTKSLDDASVITLNSSSTVNHSASTVGASKTVISLGHTLASQDFSVALSDMKSVMTGMFDRQDALHMKQNGGKGGGKRSQRNAIAAAKDAKEEAQQAREAAREVAREYKEAANEAKQDAKEAAAEMSNFLQTMMKMMLSGRSDSSTQKRKLDQVLSGRLPYSEQRQLSPMWIHANRDRSQEGPWETDNYIGELDTVYASAGEEDGDYGSYGTVKMDNKDEMTTEDIDKGPDTSKTSSMDEQTSPMDKCSQPYTTSQENESTYKSNPTTQHSCLR
jgi:hypothetical protein